MLVMKKQQSYLCFLSLLISILLLSITNGWAESEEPLKGWPRLYTNNGNEVVVHQPQLDDWQDYSLLSGKAAISVKLKDNDREYYGAMDLQASTEVDFESRTVLLKNFKVVRMTFPNLDEQLVKTCEQVVLAALPKSKMITISLDRILAGLERTKQQMKTVEVNLEPPPVYTSEKPAILVLFMGEPKFEAVENSPSLLYAVNTNWDILLEVGSSKYYMLYGQSWLVTEDILKGPWKGAGTLPKSFSKLPDDDNWKPVKQNVPGTKTEKIPEIFVSKEPAELIVTEGSPTYSPIAGTEIMYVSNTESDLFLHYGVGQHYFLTAGRWFKAKKITDPWTAASSDLPDDFRKISSDHAKGHVLSSIPGTPEAEAAVLLASIPHKATVNIKDTKVTVAYEGDPQFVVINGTETVYYAVNTPHSVFRVEEKYYCVHNGVWFVSTTATGPWVVSKQVPAVIYTIPATHPKHNVTYVYIYDSTPDTVVVGYTSGYSGSYVTATGVVMFGLGLWIGSELHDDHYHYHHYHYHPHFYSYGCAARYDYYHGGYYRSARYYGPWGGAGGAAGFNPATGTYYRGGYAHGPYGSAFAREAYNPYTNRYGGQARVQTPYGSWGRTVVADGDSWARAGHRSDYNRTVAGFGTSEGAKGIGGYNRWTDQGAVVGKNKYGDVYAGRDGNVFKKVENGWQKNSGDGWQNVDPPSPRQPVKVGVESTGQRTQSTNISQQQRAEAQARADSARQKAQSGGITQQQRDSFNQRYSNLNSDYQARQRGNTYSGNYQQRSSSGSYNFQRSGGSSGYQRSGGSRSFGGRRR